MKTDLHPKYNKNIKVTCSCGSQFLVGSTLPEIKTEICSGCHPFYTGKQKLIDSAGRVDKFMERVKKAQKMQEKMVKKVDNEMDEMFEEPTEETVETVANKEEEETKTVESETNKEEEETETAKKPTAKKAAPKKKTAKK